MQEIIDCLKVKGRIEDVEVTYHPLEFNFTEDEFREFVYKIECGGEIFVRPDMDEYIVSEENGCFTYMVPFSWRDETFFYVYFSDQASTTLMTEEKGLAFARSKIDMEVVFFIFASGG